MKIDIDYLKNLLEAFESSEEPVTDIYQLKSKGFDYNQGTFIFHMRILDDERLISTDSGKTGFGYTSGAGNNGQWSVIPLRLTSSGHSFLKNLKNKDIFSRIKADFKEEGIEMLIEISKKLAKGYINQKLKPFINSDEED